MKLECMVKYKINSGLSWPATAEKYGVTKNQLIHQAKKMRKQGLIPKLRETKPMVSISSYNIEETVKNYKSCIEKNMTNQEIMNKYNLTYHIFMTVRKIALEDKEFRKKLLNRNSMLQGKHLKIFQDSKDKTKSKAYEQAKAVIKNNWSFDEVCENLNITRGALNTNFSITLKNNFPEMLTLVKRIQSKHVNYNEKFYNLALQTMKDLRKGIKISRKDFRIKHKLSHEKIIRFLDWLKIDYLAVNIRINKMFEETANPRYVQVAKYIIEQRCTYEEAAEHFNLTRDTIGSHINISLRKNYPELYNKVKTTKKKKKFSKEHRDLALKTIKDLRKGIKISQKEFRSNNNLTYYDFSTFFKCLRVNYPIIAKHINDMFYEFYTGSKKNQQIG
jgi:hypothetical protein